MKLFRLALGALLLFSGFAMNRADAKARIEPEMYMFGFSASFTDSIVYFTDIQHVDSAWVDSKSKFLLGRDSYSYQMKNYLGEELGMPFRTCIVVYATSRKEAEKKFEKMKKLYTAKSQGGYDVRHLSSTDFTFKAVDMSVLAEDDDKEKAEKEEKKEKKKDRPKGMPPGGGQPPMGGGQPPVM